jgi:hypothetical protein
MQILPPVLEFINEFNNRLLDLSGCRRSLGTTYFASYPYPEQISNDRQSGCYYKPPRPNVIGLKFRKDIPKVITSTLKTYSVEVE